MCGLCGMLGVTHWADGDGGDSVGSPATTPRAVRLRRLRVVNAVLRHWHTEAQDWQGATMIVRGPTGQTALAPTLTDVWREAETLLGRPLDPLDPALLDRLERDLDPVRPFAR